MDDSLITVKEVADYLKLKEQTVYLLARQNKIPSLVRRRPSRIQVGRKFSLWMMKSWFEALCKKW
ncbi:MAG: hypothetical protein DMG06_26265 [Acidobacteria bacterium]|nr:MAG: hypothetical protein DMG06_26265 [Acidobacteriota bacterium]